jgi:hypothetical protein
MNPYTLNYSDMKIFNIKYIYLLLLLPILGSFSACKKSDGYNDPVSTDLTKPGVISDIKVDNYSGGSYITYALPNSKNLLYILARYNINGKTSRETKSSYYSDTITVEGFAKKQAYEVTLYAVSRANVMSDPVTVTVNPDTPPYLLMKPTVRVLADFGGLKISGDNPSKKPLGVILLAADASNGTEIVDQHYSDVAKIDYALRGYQPVEKRFGYYVTDKYGNVSDTTYQTVTPLFETLLDRNKFFTYKMNSDSPIGYGWDLPYLWDGKTDGSSNGWHTNPGGIQPIVATFGIGVSAKLSRFVLWERPDGSDRFAFGHGNIRVFSLWGSDKLAPEDVKLPKFAPEGTVLGDWTNIGNYNYPDPPSGSKPTAHTSSDNDFVKAGVSFNIPLVSPKVRYVRLCVAQSWSGGDYAHAMEMAFYGDPR